MIWKFRKIALLLSTNYCGTNMAILRSFRTPEVIESIYSKDIASIHFRDRGLYLDVYTLLLYNNIMMCLLCICNERSRKQLNLYYSPYQWRFLVATEGFCYLLEGCSSNPKSVITFTKMVSIRIFLSF